ncbi:50S ribosomal protein L24 [Candidatus Woesearchaeota archaeon]|nr:50S ribosomal protein L24 [Candidatus Woesearchaeota archaeon]
MKNKWSANWKSSKQPRKQRKYRINAPLHIKQKFVNAHLSKELKKKHSRRALALRKGDKIKIARGQFKGKTGKVDKINLSNYRVYVTDIMVAKKDGTKAFFPLHPSNLIITELILEDKKRQKILDRKNK